jgi:gluconate 5-dehydrogenase
MEYDLESLFGIKDEVAVVTGAANGIGREVVKGLGRLGAKLVLVDLDKTKLAEIERELQAEGIDVLSEMTDITSEQSVDSMVEAAMNEYGTIDILVNIAGVLYNQEAVSFDMEKWQWVMDVNVKGTFLTCRSVGRRMLERKKGRIINFSSIRGVQGKDGYHAYAPSKGAVNQLTRTLAVEWAREGINVNAVAPTFTLTDLNRSLLENKEMYEWVLGRIPKGRLCEMEWLVGPVVFLASQASFFVNGAILYVDGGWTAG